MLGVSRQHIVNLCLREEMPYTLVGTHRRIKRDDLDRIFALRPTRREELLGLWWGRAVAGAVAKNPTVVIAGAQERLAALRSSVPDSEHWWARWGRILREGPESVMATLTGLDQLSIELRACSPLTGVLTADERNAVLSSFRLWWDSRKVQAR